MGTNNTVGVLVARFQGHRLHPGWRGIIDMVRARHRERTFIVLGDHGGERTPEDPLTYDERRLMVKEVYPQDSVRIAKIMDNPISSALWSQNLDALIEEEYPGIAPKLYGSRDSFITFYSGKYPTESITPKEKYSGTELRAEARMPTTEAGREAVIYALQNRRRLVYSTVDIAIVDRGKSRVLLIGKKKWAGLYAFPGGFTEPESATDKEDAIRERCEEVLGVSVGNLKSLTPDRIFVLDPRYRRSLSVKIRTNFYLAEYESGEPSGGDDAESAKWFARDDLMKVLVPWHRPLGEILLANWQADGTEKAD